MSKIICDVCGTRYPDTADQCPICGHIREADGKTVEDVFLMEETRTEPRAKVSGGRFSKENVRKRTEGTLHYETEPVKNKEPKASKAAKKAERARPNQNEEPAFSEDKQNKKANTILNILLVIVILALLLVTGYIFTQFVLPGMSKPEPTVAPTETLPEITEPVETAAPTYPCEELILVEPEKPFVEYQEKRLINVEVKPGDTTDELIFTSSDELIAAVDAEGCITALAEGMATITISCGDIQAEYSVACIFPGVEVNPGETLPPPTDPPPTEPPEEMTVTIDNVNVRSGPGTGYDKVGKMNKGDTILVYEVQTVSGRKWGRIDEGWICLDYAK